ncbi:hypothetical protein [Leucobacter sp.]
MTDQLNIWDDVLEASGFGLVSAAQVMMESDRSVPPAALESLTGVGGAVHRFLNGLQTGRFALADAAKTAGGEVAGVLRESSALDALIADSLYSGFAVRGSGR